MSSAGSLNWKFNRLDAAFLLGVGLIAYGVGLIYLPGGFIAAGAGLVALALVSVRG